MSVIGAAAPLPARERSRRVGAPSPLLRLCAFGALALYGALRWVALLSPTPTARALGLVAIAGTVALTGPRLLARSRLLAAVAVALALLATLAVCGLPLTWIRHLRVARSVHAVASGISALPQLYIPYRGASAGVRMTILAGAGVLLLDAAAMLAFGTGGSATGGRETGAETPSVASGRHLGGLLGRAVAAVPLIALAAVPLTLMPAQLAYLHGLLLFGLLAVALWSERLPAARGGTAAALCAAAAVGALLLAPDLRGSGPWIHYRSAGVGAGAGPSDAFDWRQTYGPLDWPQQGREMLRVSAARPAYWKAVNLDSFDGVAWRIGVEPGATTALGIPAAARARFTERIAVAVGSMTSREIIGAGETARPLGATGSIAPGASPGTWVTAPPLSAGETYTASVYVPEPTVRQEQSAGTHYPPAVATRELSIGVVTRSGVFRVRFPAFGAPAARRVPAAGVIGEAALRTSAYAPVLALARRLRDGAPTPYSLVRRVLAFLGHGYTYDQRPRARPTPLVSFLLADRRGYCQQFAGAMALLLRMGGVPARVAAGFTSGQYDVLARRWIVSDLDAHAWVEAFFPGFGWVRFDPTPAVDPALHGPNAGPLASGAGSSAAAPGRPAKPGGHGLQTPGAASPADRGARRSHSGSAGGFSALSAAVAVAVLAALMVLAARWRRRRPERASGVRTDAEARVRELERAFARMGRPLGPATTLSALERRLRNTPGAAAYVAGLRAARFAPPGGEALEPPLRGARADVVASAAGRRALRRYLRSGLGVTGGLRALWALPPARGPHGRNRRLGIPDRA